MKKTKAQLIRFFNWIEKTGTAIENFTYDLFGWFNSLWTICFKDIKKPAVMWGFSVWWFATRYARKRDNRWQLGWDQEGKRQSIIPADDTRIIVCSRLEVKNLQRNGIIPNVVSVNRFFKRGNYYMTEMKYKHKNK